MSLSFEILNIYPLPAIQKNKSIGISYMTLDHDTSVFIIEHKYTAREAHGKPIKGSGNDTPEIRMIKSIA